MNLAEIRRLQLEAQTQLESALAEVLRIAARDPAGVRAAAEVTGYRRELDLLRKQELDLITHGRAEPTPTESPA